MSLSGPSVLQALDDALHDIRREEDEILRKLGRSGERVAKVRETEGEMLRRLAVGRIEPEREIELSGSVLAAEKAARRRLEERAQQLAATTGRLARLDRELSALAASRMQILAEIDRQQTALKGLSSRIASAIARDTDYEREQQNLARRRAVAAAARAKARQAELDREQKGRPYRADPLFMYLLERGYGTPGYRAGALAARLDRWVAELVGFETARLNFAMLDALPARLRTHADEQAARAIEAENAIDEIERAAIDAAGGGAVRSALATAQMQIEETDAQLLALQDERDRLMADETALSEAGDPALERALTALVEGLGSPDVAALIAAARQARPGPDHPLVAQLDDLRLRIVEEQIDARDLHARLTTLALRRRALEDIEYELKALKFDDPRSVFRDDELVGSELNQFLTGAIEPQTYWNAFRRSQAWTAGTSDWGGGIGLPRHGRQPAEAPPRDADGFNRPRSAAESADA